MFKMFSWTNISFFPLTSSVTISNVSVSSECPRVSQCAVGQTGCLMVRRSTWWDCCSDPWWAELFQTGTHSHTCTPVGGGALLTQSGFLCRYGKRPVLLACACVQAFCGLVPAVFPQPLLFLAIRCLTAVCCCCINICAFSLGNDHHSAASSSQTVQWLFSEEVLVHLQNEKKRQTYLDQSLQLKDI